jgi:hypothetical protein
MKKICYAEWVPFNTQQELTDAKNWLGKWMEYKLIKLNNPEVKEWHYVLRQPGVCFSFGSAGIKFFIEENEEDSSEIE